MEYLHVDILAEKWKNEKNFAENVSNIKLSDILYKWAKHY